MYYYGYFRNLDTSRDKKGWLYKVVVITNFRNDEFDMGGELLLDGDSPISISYETDENDIYKPYKCSTATITLQQQDYNFAFNDTKGGNVLVMLLKAKNTVNTEERVTDKQINPQFNKQLQIDRICYNIEWIGFATPNAYSQDYASFFDSFELECQDALSTLQYYPYKYNSKRDPLFEDNPNISFLDIIKNNISLLRQYNKIYVSSTLQLPTLEDGDILNFIKVDQRNFFDEDGKAMNVLEVIEEMMKYLNLSIIPYRDALYIIDYEGLANGYNEYYEYVRDYEKIYPFNVNTDAKFILQSNKALLEDYHTIVKDDFSSDDAQISIQGIANKFTVKDSLYPYEEIQPNWEGNKKILFSEYMQSPQQLNENVVISEGNGKLITDISSDPKYLDYVETVKEDGVKRVVDRDYVDKDLIIFCDSTQMKTENKKAVPIKQKVYLKYCGYDNWSPTVFDNSQIMTYWYEDDMTVDENGTVMEDWFSFGDPYLPSINDSRGWNYDFCTKHVGAQLIQYHSEKVDEFGEYPKQLELKPAIMICNGGKYRLKGINKIKGEFEKGKTQTMFMLKTKNITVGCGDFFHIDMKWMFYPRILGFGTLPIISMLPIEITPNYTVHENKQRFYIRFGNKYYDGKKWVGYMKPYDAEFDIEIGDEDSAFGKELKFKPMIDGRDYNFKDLLNIKDGLIIPSPYANSDDLTMSGNLEISVERPYGLCNDVFYHSALITDIKVEVVTKSTVYDYCSQEDDTDTEYSNVIEEDELIEVERSQDNSITTWDRKQTNYSSTIFSRYLDDESNDNLRVTQLFNIANGEILRAEELAIANKVNQYSTPTLNLSLSLHHIPSPFSIFTYKQFHEKLFIVNGMEFDYFRNSYLINLSEKK